MSNFYIELGCFASHKKPQEVISELPELARRLGLSVQVKLNDITITVFPDATIERVLSEWEKTIARNLTYMIV